MSSSLSVLLKESLEISNFEVKSHLYEYFMSLLCICTRLVCVNVLCKLVPTRNVSVQMLNRNHEKNR